MNEHRKPHSDFSTQLRLLRKQKNISQEKLSEIMGYYPKFISKLETEALSPSLDVLIDLSQYFNVSLDYLVFGEGNKEPTLQSTITQLSSNEIKAVTSFAQFLTNNHFFDDT